MAPAGKASRLHNEQEHRASGKAASDGKNQITLPKKNGKFQAESDGEQDFYGGKSHWQQNQSLGAESCAKNEDLEQQKKQNRPEESFSSSENEILTGRLQKTQEKIQSAMNRSRGRKYTKTRGPVRAT
jgi:hypothetical protein